MSQKHNSRLEIHVPPAHSAERPAIRYSHVTLDLDIEEDPLANQLPKQTGSFPVVSEGFYSFVPFSASSDQPMSLKRYLTTDEPLVSLHVTSFNDATLVSITFPHVLGDVTATAALVKAWSSVALGQQDQVPPILGATNDVLESIRASSNGKDARQPFVLQHMQLRGLSLLVFTIRHLWDMLLTPRVYGRFIFLPAKFIQQLRREAEDEVEIRRQRGDTDPSFVSDNDLISAWGSRMVILSRTSPLMSRSAAILNVFNLRPRLRETASGTYVQNLIMASTALLAPGSVAMESTGQIALRVREALQQQTTEEQTRSLVHMASMKGAGTPLFAHADSMVVSWTNWSQARLDEAVAALGAATAKDGKQTESIASNTRYLTHWGAGLNMENGYRDGFVIYGRNSEGDYWLHGFLREKTWDLIRQSFDSFGR